MTVRTTYLMTTFLVAVLLTAMGVVGLWRTVGYQGLVVGWQWAMVEIEDGSLRVGFAHWAYRGYLQHRRRAVSVEPQAYLSLGLLGNVVVRCGIRPGKWRYIGLTLPLWTVVALLFAHPAVAFIRGPLRRRRRHRRNQCVNCAYDRTGNTSGVCPECGTRFDHTL